MKKSANTLLFEKQLARIERILNKSEHSDLTIQKPTRITKSFLTRLEKIKPKNIESVIESGDFTFTNRPSKDFSRLVDQTKTSRSKASAKAKASASASTRAKAKTQTSTPHLSTTKTKSTSDLSSRYKALKKTQSTPQSPKRKSESESEEESKKASPSLFGGGVNDVLQDFENWDEYDEESTEENSSVDQTGARYVEYHGDYLDRETGEVIENIRSTMVTDDEEFSKLDVARERWEEYSADAREGSQVTDVINRYISGYGADVVFANMSNFGPEFWEALDVCHRYETQGMWGGEDDEGAAWVGAGEYAENIDFIINYMFEKFDPWFGPEQMD